MVQVVKCRLVGKTKCAQKSSDNPREGLKVKGHSKYESCIPPGLSPSERKLYLNKLYEKHRPARYGSRRKKSNKAKIEGSIKKKSEGSARKEVKEEVKEEVLKEVKEENQQDSDLEQDGDHGIQPPLLFSDSDAEFHDPPQFPQWYATEHDSVQTDTRLLEAVPTAPLAFSSSSSCSGCSDLTKKLEAMGFEKSKMASNCSELTTKLEAMECEKSKMASHCSELTMKLEAFECEKSKMASHCSELTMKLEAIECEKSKMASHCSELTAKLEAIECERSRLARKAEWYEQVRDWVQSRGERLVVWMVENGSAPPALVWGGDLIQRQNAAV